MPTPNTFKSPVLLTVVGCCGTGGIGIIGWQIWEESHPTGDKQLSRNGFKWGPVTPTLKSDTSTGLHQKTGNNPGGKFHLEYYDCFKKFFPDVTVDHTYVSGTEQMDDPIQPSSVPMSSVEPIGCALMNLSYQGVTDSNRNTKYIFKSEITVKNDRFGWALWAGAKDMTAERKTGAESDSSQSDAMYYLIFLKKDDKNWSILGGYNWSDFGASATSYLQAQLRIFAPNKKDWASLIRAHKGNIEKKFQGYSGVWEVAKEGNEIFQDIELWYGNADKDGSTTNRAGAAEILGRTFAKDKTEIDFLQEPKINTVGKGYKDSVGWQKLKGTNNNKDVGDVLNKLYSPFKGKKGIWKETKDYCKEKSAKRNLSEYDLEKLASLCYSKQ